LNAYEYYRVMHPEITKTDIKSFTERYRQSDEEANDLIDFYEEHEGDISGVLECIMCSNNEDGPRFIEFFEEKIKLGLIERTKLFDSTKGKIKTLADEKAEAKQEKKKLKEKKAAKSGGDMAGLEAMILAKKNAGGGFMAYMENKYGGDEPEKPKKKAVKRSQPMGSPLKAKESGKRKK
jgi:DnaJ family protein C protein 9